MRDLVYYIRLVDVAVGAVLGVVLVAIGIYLMDAGINVYYSVTDYYATYIGNLEAHLHPSQYAQAFDIIYVYIGISFVLLFIGSVLLFFSIRGFMKLPRKNAAVDIKHSDYRELDKIKTLFEQGDISREAYEMYIKRLQK